MQRGRVVFCDISKAFDRVWHDGLLFKLRSIGISGRLRYWFRNYLADRKQRVVINGRTYKFKLVEAGVPQGVYNWTAFISNLHKWYCSRT